MVSKPTCRALCAGRALCCWGQVVKVVSEPTCRALCCRGAGCLSSVGTYLPGTVLQGCRLFKRCQNLLAGLCVAGVEAVKGVSEPTCRAPCCRGAGCLSHVGTYLPGTVLQGCRLFKRCWNLPVWHCVQGCMLLKWSSYLPIMHCGAGGQSVQAVS